MDTYTQLLNTNGFRQVGADQSNTAGWHFKDDCFCNLISSHNREVGGPDKIGMIKELRNRTGLGLMEAKQCVEAIMYLELGYTSYSYSPTNKETKTMAQTNIFTTEDLTLNTSDFRSKLTIIRKNQIRNKFMEMTLGEILSTLRQRFDYDLYKSDWETMDKMTKKQLVDLLMTCITY